MTHLRRYLVANRQRKLFARNVRRCRSLANVAKNVLAIRLGCCCCRGIHQTRLSDPQRIDKMACLEKEEENWRKLVESWKNFFRKFSFTVEWGKLLGKMSTLWQMICDIL
jgi:hypothetical protein